MKNGFALATALVILALMTVLAAATWHVASIDERSSAAVYHRGIAFQAAEAALRVGEALTETIRDPSQYCYPKSPGKYYCSGRDNNQECDNLNACTAGLCQQPDSDCPRRWLSDDFRGWVSIDPDFAAKLGLDPENLPEFFVEYLGQSDSRDIYRITARSSNPDSNRPFVMLQSIYVP